ncbi:very short patch repair endonuclease [Bradyrhizobium sp.]
MADIVDKPTRSRMMSGIQGKDTAPELILRKAMHGRGFRFRLHAAELPGKPDLVFPRYRAVVLAHGCFWHRHKDCAFATTPSSNTGFWEDKFAKTVLRDQRNIEYLKQAGWRIAVVWECNLKGKTKEKIADKLAKWLKSKVPYIEITPVVR